MTVWEDIQNALSDFWNWLTGVGGGFTDTLGELGSWIYGGIKWLADQIYNAWTYFSDWLYSGLQWLGDRLKEGYEAIAQWISGGLQWIGSGLSWIGQQLYSFGQWLWNGIIWVARTVANAVEGFINWVWEGIVGIYNDIVNYLASWVRGINDFLNSWILSLRDKFKSLALVNISLDGLFKSFDVLIDGKIKEGLIGMFVTPFAGALAVELIDVIIPRPSSERIIFFPEFDMPTLTYTPITIQKPETPTTPAPTEIPTSPITPPAIGYKPIVEKANTITTLYEIVKLGEKTLEQYNCVTTQYEVSIQEITEVSQFSSVESGFDIVSTTPLTVSKQNVVRTMYEAQAVPIITEERLNTIKTMYEIISTFGAEVVEMSKIETGYDVFIHPLISQEYAQVVRSLYEIEVESPPLEVINTITTQYEASWEFIDFLENGVLIIERTFDYDEIEQIFQNSTPIKIAECSFDEGQSGDPLPNPYYCS